jgi:hypothetical protein
MFDSAAVDLCDAMGRDTTTFVGIISTTEIRKRRRSCSLLYLESLLNFPLLLLLLQANNQIVVPGFRWLEEAVDNTVKNWRQLRSSVRSRSLLGVIRSCWLVADASVNKEFRRRILSVVTIDVREVSFPKLKGGSGFRRVVESVLDQLTKSRAANEDRL